MHDLASRAAPLQPLPPLAGGGLLQRRTRVTLPSPQVVVQDDHGDQRPQLPSVRAGQTKIITNSFIFRSFCWTQKPGKDLDTERRSGPDMFPIMIPISRIHLSEVLLFVQRSADPLPPAALSAGKIKSGRATERTHTHTHTSHLCARTWPSYSCGFGSTARCRMA